MDRDAMDAWVQVAKEQTARAERAEAEVRAGVKLYVVWHPDVRVGVRQVEGRLVPCDVPGCTTLKPGDVSYGRDAVRPWRDHDHFVPYDTPHEQIVIRLPVEPVRERS